MQSPGIVDPVTKEGGSTVSHSRGNCGLNLPVGSWGGTWSLMSHPITVAILKDAPWSRPGILEGSRAGPRAASLSRWLAGERKGMHRGILGNSSSCKENPCGILLEGMSVTYTMQRVDFEEVRWPRESLSVLNGGSGGGEEICMPCLCTQVSHQAWGPGLKSLGMTKLLVCEGHQ